MGKNEKNEKAWVNKGVALGKLGKYDEALKCFSKGTNLDSRALRSALPWLISTSSLKYT